MKSSYEELRAAVMADGGLHIITMGVLRDIQGAGRLGSRVLGTISGQLSSHGMGHLPKELPANQDSPVRIYLLGTPIAEIVDAVHNPSLKGDEILRGAGCSEARAQLQKIREIIGG
ncbi:hypothetical protein [Streptomyces sp. SLBN-134]|uniref:hypothetical protein n=1 Tax=Streptomyces sp. SLBN-134 TaxID=2768456 RepID=UPI0011528966|nr:hypothetical protein [Streptomyces sp. SLBN-134]TQL21232.1 hypothetical protein FBY37_3209 [Streptomyces sp. SLBN-134]